MKHLAKGASRLQRRSCWNPSNERRRNLERQYRFRPTRELKMVAPPAESGIK